MLERLKKPFSHYLGQAANEIIFFPSTTPADVESLVALNQTHWP